MAVTGASGHVGTALRRRLEQLPNQVRSLGREDDLVAASNDADAVVHLAGTLQPGKPNTYRTANLDPALAPAAALDRSPAKRVVYLSFLTARLNASNSYLRYKAGAEEVLRSTGVPRHARRTRSVEEARMAPWASSPCRRGSCVSRRPSMSGRTGALLDEELDHDARASGAGSGGWGRKGGPTTPSATRSVARRSPPGTPAQRGVETGGHP